MKKTITIRQAVAGYNAIAKMKDAGISPKGLKNIDMAMNKAAVAPIVEGYQKAIDRPAAIEKYFDELNIGKSNPNFNLEKCKEKYKDAIEEYDRWRDEVKTMADATREVDIIEIEKTDLKLPDDNGLAAEILFGLLPFIKM